VKSFADRELMFARFAFPASLGGRLAAMAVCLLAGGHASSSVCTTATVIEEL
jgi:hypothetical protein